MQAAGLPDRDQPLEELEVKASNPCLDADGALDQLKPQDEVKGDTPDGGGHAAVLSWERQVLLGLVMQMTYFLAVRRAQFK
jgi:hypothetical protein